LSIEKRVTGATFSEDAKGIVARPFRSEKRVTGATFSEREKVAPCCEKVAPRDMKEPEVTKREEKKARARPAFVPPAAEEVLAYADTLGDPQFDADYFVQWYTDRGWQHKDGRPVLDWKGTVRTWIHRDNQRRIARGEPPHDGYSQYGCHPATEEDIERLRKAGVFHP
jgi:hypothetical protein